VGWEIFRGETFWGLKELGKGKGKGCEVVYHRMGDECGRRRRGEISEKEKEKEKEKKKNK